MKQDNTISTGLDALFGGEKKTAVNNKELHPENTVRGHGRPRKGEKPNDIGLEMRTSLIVNKENYDKIREIALTESLTLKEVVNFSFELAIEKYEEKNGKIGEGKRTRKKEELFGK